MSEPASPASVFGEIFAKNAWQGSVRSGPGSSLRATALIRPQLRDLFRELAIRTLCDAPCGDCTWVTEIIGELENYVGVDVVEELIGSNSAAHMDRNVSFLCRDIAAETVPQADAILCRDCLVHLPLEMAGRVLTNFAASGGTYLIATTFPAVTENRDSQLGGWRPLNLELPPFSLPPPIRLLREREIDPADPNNSKSLGVWRVSEIHIPRVASRGAEDATALLALRKVRLEARDYTGAAEIDDRLIRLDPRSADHYRRAAWTKSALKHHDEALALQLKASELAPTRANLAALAKLYHLLNRPDDEAAVNVRRAALASAESEQARSAQLAEARRASANMSELLQLALPSWAHDDEAPIAGGFEALDRFLSDAVANWTDRPITHPPGTHVVFEGLGSFVVGDTKQVIHKRLGRGVPWELPVAALMMELSARCRADRAIVEVGANIGTITVPSSRASAKAPIFAFEPEDGNYQDLLANLKLNACRNVKALKMACSDVAGSGVMELFDANNPGTFRLHEGEAGSVEVTTIDAYFENRPVGIIKIDAEGHEPKIIQGARRTLSTWRPLLICELLSEHASATTHLLNEAGYSG